MKKKNYQFKLKNIWDVENTFYLKSKQSRIYKTICHYEIFKQSIKAKGSIVECGVFKGVSLIRFLTFRNLILKNQSKKVYGFDVFGNFPRQNLKRDNNFANYHNTKIGLGISSENLKKNLKKKNFKNFKLIRGNIFKTVPNFLKSNKNFKISFLHLDLDVYEPTLFALNAFFKHLSPRGVILLDDYGLIDGATEAVDEFIKKNNLKLKNLDFDRKLKFIVK